MPKRGPCSHAPVGLTVWLVEGERAVERFLVARVVEAIDRRLVVGEGLLVLVESRVVPFTGRARR